MFTSSLYCFPVTNSFKEKLQTSTTSLFNWSERHKNSTLKINVNEQELNNNK